LGGEDVKFQLTAEEAERSRSHIATLKLDLTAQRLKVAASLQELERRIAAFTESLAHSDALITLEGDATSATRRACEAYAAIDYQTHDDAETSLVCLGVIGTSAEVLRKANAVNNAKEEFKALCAPLHRIQVRIPVKGEKTPTKTLSAMRVILRNIQRSDLNLLSSYRKIPILTAPPATVTYTRANTRSVYRKTVDEVADLLQNLNSSAAMADRERLAALERRVTHLALVKDHYQNIRANVLYARLDPKGRGRIQISAELPLIYAMGRRAEPPEVHFPRAEDTTELKRSRKSILEPGPYLRSLPVYRYSE
jgi:hypothetical protein